MLNTIELNENLVVPTFYLRENLKSVINLDSIQYISGNTHYTRSESDYYKYPVYGINDTIPYLSAHEVQDIIKLLIKYGKIDKKQAIAAGYKE